MRPLSLTIIRDEHQALAAMLRSLPMLLAQARRRLSHCLTRPSDSELPT